MFGYLLILFTVLPALELALLIKIGSHIGVSSTLAIIILTGVVGASLARLQGFIVLQKIQNNINNGIMPEKEMMDGLMILVGGIVLLTPGFITDALGLVLLLPLTRNWIKKLIQKKIEETIKKGNVVHISGFNGKDRHFDNIDI